MNKSRRQFLASTAAVPVGVAIGASQTGQGASGYETIQLDPGESRTYDLSDGETFENVLIDQTAAGATYAIRARGVDDFTVRNVGFYGVGDRWDDSAANQHMLLSGNGTVENVYISNFPTSDDADDNTPMGGIYIRPSHSGHIDIRHTYIDGMGNNASYGDRPGREGGGGTITYENCYHRDNTVSQFRIGTSGTEIRNCLGIVDDPNLKRATYIASDSRTARGVWAWHNDDMRVRDSTFYINPNDPEASNTFHARMHDESSGSHCELNVDNCYVNADAPNLVSEGPGDATVNLNGLTEEPTASVLGNGGVPTSAEMAASGQREYVDPFDEGIDGGGGGGTTPPDDEPSDDPDGNSDSEYDEDNPHPGGSFDEDESVILFSGTHLRDEWDGSQSTDYTLEVSGDLYPSTHNSASVDSDLVMDADDRVEHTVYNWKDAYVFTGEVTRLEADGPANIYVNGEDVDPETYPDGSGGSDGSDGTSDDGTDGSSDFSDGNSDTDSGQGDSPDGGTSPFDGDENPVEIIFGDSGLLDLLFGDGGLFEGLFG